MATKVGTITTRESDAMPEGAARRALPVRVRQVPGADRVLRFIASTEEVARDGDIIRVTGWETERFEKNPVFLWGHRYDEPPIGRVIRIRKVARPKDGREPRLEIDVEFAGLTQLHERAETVCLLYRDAFLNAVSVGFLPLEFQDLTDDQKKELGLGAWGRVIKRAELLEVSAVPVPADSGAVLIEDDEDRAAVKAALLSVRALAPVEEQPRFDALAASLDADPAPASEAAGPAPMVFPVTFADTVAVATIMTELRSIRALVDERLPITRTTPDVPVPQVPADAPATPVSPPTPAPDTPRTTDFYGIVEARLSRHLSHKDANP